MGVDTSPLVWKIPIPIDGDSWLKLLLLLKGLRYEHVEAWLVAMEDDTLAAVVSAGVPTNQAARRGADLLLPDMNAR